MTTKILHRAAMGVTQTVNGSVIFSILGNGVALLAAPITMLAITRIFTPEMQGYYYTFSSLISVQIFFELGFGQLLVQMVGHDSALISKQTTFSTIVDQNLIRLKSLCVVSQRWYTISAFIVFPILIVLGLYLFSKSPDDVKWFWPWISASMLVALNFVLLPFFYVLQGLGRVREYWFYRLLQKVLASGTIIGAILLGSGLWTHTISFTALFGFSLVFMYLQRDIARYFTDSPKPLTVSWRQDIFPRQWRAAVQWLVLTFAMSILTPVAFFHLGAVTAGKLGLAIGLCTAIFGLSTNPLLVYAPRFSALAATKKIQELNGIFLRVVAFSLLLWSGAGLSIVIVIALLPSIDLTWSERFPDLVAVVWLLLATCGSVLVAAIFIYFRCYDLEPFAPHSLTLLVTAFLLANIGAVQYGLAGIIVPFTLLVLLFSANAVMRFLRFRRSLLIGETFS